jgi:hypothetical protein
MKRTFRITAFAMALLFSTSHAEACKCGKESFSVKFDNASLVFLGTTTSDANGKYQFKIKKVWKGRIGEDDIVHTTEDCGYHFYPKTDYVVFANSEKGKFSTGMCSGSTPSTPTLLKWLDENHPVKK